MKKIVLAGGCFWGVEEYISRINGVTDTEVGYANGNRKYPTYEQVCTGTTGHAEAVKVEYDENNLPLYTLLKKFFSIIDPTIENRQGPDRGTQYRTGIYYIDENEKDTILKVVQEEQKKYHKKIVTEIEPLNSFYEAEEYHQDYLKKNPNGYCHIDLS
ncbi:peptide-methionine (S)-S-oxide reductase MsrA [Senegalia massiliensis]|uniref:Peptide methionine sulfoxide reductase MsrA n=1 Tax=Senegalia massiliensis TaxID=1720316 RepID=A0A845QYR1_9CLOT|nr:peptide-methionine (S)-S-oxide reductase MsrA [Senegalia massiliensis]NBI05523.1 peptide-methionine (S)-S-oxide reductase [Senegalia massiliensis]